MSANHESYLEAVKTVESRPLSAKEMRVVLRNARVFRLTVEEAEEQFRNHLKYWEGSVSGSLIRSYERGDVKVITIPSGGE